jgi:DNA-binding NarL/FixJ family response regulator
MNILIVEDHPLYRDALTRLLLPLVGSGQVRAVGSVEEGLFAVDSLPELGMVLLDMDLPGMSGMEALAILAAKCPDVPVFVVSGSEDRRKVTQALRSGARAFISKDIAAESMLDILRALLISPIDPPQWITAHGVSNHYDTSISSAISTMTSRQKEVLALLSKGLTNKDIAYRLNIADITVKVHLSAVFRKLGVVNRTQAVVEARRIASEMG